jgi:hypothetical protein
MTHHNSKELEVNTFSNVAMIHESNSVQCCKIYGDINMVVVNKLGIGITKWTHHKHCLWIYKHRGVNSMVLGVFWNASMIKDSTNDIEPTSAPKI